MTHRIARLLGVLLTLIGVVWTLQGVGLLGGSFMTGSRLWLVIGVVTTILGVGVLVRDVRRRSADRERAETGIAADRNESPRPFRTFRAPF